MQYVNLGAGLHVSCVCLGMMSFGKHKSREWVLQRAFRRERSLVLAPKR